MIIIDNDRWTPIAVLVVTYLGLGLFLIIQLWELKTFPFLPTDFLDFYMRYYISLVAFEQHKSIIPYICTKRLC